MRTARIAFVAFALVTVGGLGPSGLLADESPGDVHVARRLMDKLDLSGSLRASYWSSSRRLDDQHDLGVAALWFRGRWQPAPAVAVVGDGWLMNDDLFEPGATAARLREAYVDLTVGALDVRVGQQIIAWGRADRINPTDNLTSRDFTLLVPEDNDQRRGSAGVAATYHLGGIALTGVWLATFHPHVIPIEAPPAPFLLVPRRVPTEPLGQFAFKIDRTGADVDWSVSFFDGFNPYPALEIVEIGATAIAVAPTHHRIRVIGADGATVAGPYGLRAEMAYVFTEDRQHRRLPSPFFFMVLGADRTVLGSLYLNAQFVLRVISDYRDPAQITDPVQRAVFTAQATINDQLDPVSQSVALRIGKKWVNDTLETEVSSVVGLVRLDYAVRPKVRYAITDRLRMTVGADIFRGHEPSLFGRIRDMSTAYVELRWDF